MPNRCSTSASVSEAVGSSMMRTRAFCDRALAISTRCRLPTSGRPPCDPGPGRGCRARRGSRAPSPASGSSRCRPTPPRRVADEDVLGHGELGEEQQLLVDVATRPVAPRAGCRTAPRVPSSCRVPPSGPWTPEMILISVDLPAPFSPRSACTSPGAKSNRTPSSARTPGNVLLTESSLRTGCTPPPPPCLVSPPPDREAERAPIAAALRARRPTMLGAAWRVTQLPLVSRNGRRLLSGFRVVSIGLGKQACDEGAEERLAPAAGVVDELEEAEIGTTGSPKAAERHRC